jgi:TonB family protein
MKNFLLTVAILFLLTTGLKAQNPDTTNKNSIKSEVKSTIPVFPHGGPEGWSHFISHYLRYPKEPYMNGIQGQVLIEMYVETDGKLTNFKVIKSPSVDLTNESLRVLALSPKWTPATLNGKPVRAKYTVPINFTLSR